MSVMDEDGASTPVPRAGSPGEDRDPANNGQSEKENASKHYKSWKKKYRKMRIIFDQKMEDGDKLHSDEQRALATAKRLAIQNDRLLDLLLENNESPQIPLDKRIDISMGPPSDSELPQLDIDRPRKNSEEPLPTKSLKNLLKEVPHYSFAQAKERAAPEVADMEPFDGESYPPNFVTPDDLDDYTYEIDTQLASAPRIPTLAPASRREQNGLNTSTMSQNIALRNPTSVYNWLRKHAPKTFLQDGEASAGAADAADHAEEHVDGRKKRSAKGERGGKGSRGGKRASLAAAKAEARAEAKAEKAAADGRDASVEDDPDFGVTPSTARNKRKRGDDDSGYRPKGSSSRPAKKKRKSDVEGTPTISKRSRKSDAAQIKDD